MVTASWPDSAIANDKTRGTQATPQLICVVLTKTLSSALVHSNHSLGGLPFSKVAGRDDKFARETRWRPMTHTDEPIIHHNIVRHLRRYGRASPTTRTTTSSHRATRGHKKGNGTDKHMMLVTLAVDGV